MSPQPPTLPPIPANKFSAKFLELTNLLFVDGALSVKTKELIALAVAHVTQCDHCIEAHTQRAVNCGATKEELTEAIWVATVMRAAASMQRSRAAFSILEGLGR
jgi:AhpD family alkylhydroperoxidase